LDGTVDGVAVGIITAYKLITVGRAKTTITACSAIFVVVVPAAVLVSLRLLTAVLLLLLLPQAMVLLLHWCQQ
jgi:hypothetical protein